MIKSKFSKVIASAALLLCVGSAQAAVTELAINGGFETGDYTGWEVFPQTGQNLIGTGNGTLYSGNSTLPGGPADNLIKQSNRAAGLIQTGEAITISFDARGSLGVSAVVQAILFNEFSGGGAAPQFFDFQLNGDEDVWTSYVFNTTAGSDVSGGVTLALKTGCGAVGGCFADVYFDNVSFTADIAAVPVPAAAWLFGSALLGLGGIARKRKAA